MSLEKRQKTPNPASLPAQMADVLGLALVNAENWRTPGRVLGLDLELVNTGLVILTDRGHILRSTTFRCPLTSTKKKKVTERDRVDRILRLANEIIGIIRNFRIKHIAIEGGGASFGGKSQVLQRGGLFYVVLTQIWLACHIFPEIVTANSARKTVLGYGGSGKNQKEKVLEALALNKIIFETDHEADAYVTARWLFENTKGKVME